MQGRLFQLADREPVCTLFVAAFTDAESAAEGELIGSLVRELATTTPVDDLLGFVSEIDDVIVGAIFFSRLRFDSGAEAFLLSPVAVATAHQGQGVGQALIRCGLQTLQERGVGPVMTYGDPAFYSRVGFAPINPADVRPPFTLSQPEGWLGLTLAGGSLSALSGASQCVPAFNDPRYW